MNYTFTVPLISSTGLNTAGTSGKLFPVGSVGNLLLRIQTTPLLPFASTCTAIGAQQLVYQITLDSFNLNMNYVNIGEISGALLKQSLYDGKYFIKSCTYTGANASCIKSFIKYFIKPVVTFQFRYRLEIVLLNLFFGNFQSLNLIELQTVFLMLLILIVHQCKQI